MELLKVLFLVQLFGQFLLCYAEISDNCQTPNGTQGQCKLLTECTNLYEIIKQDPVKPEDADYLRRSMCGTFNRLSPKVCCPSVKVSRRISNNVGGAVDFCQTSRKEQGECKVITKCPVFRTILRRESVSPEEASYMRDCQCGSEGNLPKVCCPFQVTPVNSNLLPSLDVCGIQTEDRIVGGNETNLKAYSWMALLQYQFDDGRRAFRCGGSLINKRYVLTAAHCLDEVKLVNVRLGEHNINTDPDCIEFGKKRICNPAPIDIPVEETIIHEGYNEGDVNKYHDIALVRLAREVHFSDYIKPICLPTTVHVQKENLDGKKLAVAGWGLTESQTGSPIKLSVKVPYNSNKDCASTYARSHVNLCNGQLCAGGEEGKGSCVGDSGGPLMRLFKDDQNNLNYYCIGVVSFGPKHCGQDMWPGIYTKVDSYVQWIVGKLRP